MLSTSRLVLRPFNDADAGFILVLLNDPAFHRYIGDKGVRTKEDARAYIAAGPAAMYRQYGFCLFRVALSGTDEPIGMCGLLKRDMLDAPDIGFAFLPQYRSQGYAFEAAREVLRDACERLKLDRVMAIVNAENASSKALLAKLGMHFVRTAPAPGGEREVEVWEVRSES